MTFKTSSLGSTVKIDDGTLGCLYKFYIAAKNSDSYAS